MLGSGGASKFEALVQSSRRQTAIATAQILATLDQIEKIVVAMPASEHPTWEANPNVAQVSGRLQYDFDLPGVQFHFGNRIAEITPHGDITLSSCGWETVTTKSRLNAVLDVFFTGFGIWQNDFTWYIGQGGDKDEFFDGYKIIR